MFRIIIISVAMMTQPVYGNHIQMYLQDALNLKLVKTSIVSLGGHSGFCIKMSVENLTNDSLVVYLQAGRKLNSIDDKYQDILIVKDDHFFLKKRQTLTHNIKGYCCQARNSSPGRGAKYNIPQKLDSNLFILGRYLNASSFESGIEQFAIWAVSDKKPTATITGSNDSVSIILRNFVAELKNEPIPWYTLITSAFTYSGGQIGIVPRYLKGELEYSLEKSQYSTCLIKNDHGKLVGSIVRKWLVPGNNQKYALNIPLEGLIKGKYTIELMDEHKSLVSKEFEI